MSEIPDTALAEFRALAVRRLGLWFDHPRQEFLADVLRERADACGGDLAAYLKTLSSPGGAREEWRTLAPQLTVTETYFLRGAEHFQALVGTVLPACLRTRPPAQPLRFLSAGCASGEEAYSLAISLHESGVPSGRAVEILGVDVNREALERARSGRYTEWSLRETPPEIRARYFRRAQSEYVLDAAVAAMVTFLECNLVEPNADLWQPGRFDVVFCRNVLMYLAPETAAAVVDRIQRSLAPGGCLFLGHAETLRGLSQAFHLRHDHGAFYYQLREKSGPSVAPEPMIAAPAAPAPMSAAEAAAAPVWMEEIGRASARIATLAAAAPRPEADAAVPPAPVSTAGAIRRVLDLHQQERFSDALAHLQNLPPGAAPDADLQVLRAMLLVNCGRLAEAEALCRSLLGSDELDAGAHYVAALCREHAGDLAAAAEHDAAATYLDPSFAMPYFHLGLLNKRLGRAPEAVAHFETALALLVKEEPARLLLFGGGFSRETLVQACRAEIQRLRPTP